MYSGSYEMPRCSACEKEILPSELSESFSCPKCSDYLIWRCEKCKGTAKKYTCNKCNYTGNKSA